MSDEVCAGCQKPLQPASPLKFTSIRRCGLKPVCSDLCWQTVWYGLEPEQRRNDLPGIASLGGKTFSVGFDAEHVHLAWTDSVIPGGDALLDPADALRLGDAIVKAAQAALDLRNDEG
jgi:hypothetical protein